MCVIYVPIVMNIILCSYIVLLIIRKNDCKITRSGALRVVGGYEANATEYPYIISVNLLFMDDDGSNEFFIKGSGILISPVWVLSASHVFEDEETEELFIVYGTRPHSIINPLKLGRNLSRVKKIFFHPLYKSFWNDIALAQIDEVDVAQYARLSSIEYTTLLGLHVQYAGYGYTAYYNFIEKDYDRLYFGQGGIVPCDDDNSIFNPSLCVVPKCSDLRNFPNNGDSGGPLFYNNSVIGVLGGSAIFLLREERDPVSEYTPVSPYLDWIFRVTINVNKHQADTTTDEKETPDKTFILRSDKIKSNRKKEQWSKIIAESKARKIQFRNKKFGNLRG